MTTDERKKKLIHLLLGSTSINDEYPDTYIYKTPESAKKVDELRKR